MSVSVGRGSGRSLGSSWARRDVVVSVVVVVVVVVWDPEGRVVPVGSWTEAAMARANCSSSDSRSN